MIEGPQRQLTVLLVMSNAKPCELAVAPLAGVPKAAGGLAAATIAVAHMNKISVPDKLSVVGFDDTQLATTVWPNLSTVRQPIAAMANRAIELLASGKLVDTADLTSDKIR